MCRIPPDPKINKIVMGTLQSAQKHSLNNVLRLKPGKGLGFTRRKIVPESASEAVGSGCDGGQ